VTRKIAEKYLYFNILSAIIQAGKVLDIRRVLNTSITFEAKEKRK